LTTTASRITMKLANTAPARAALAADPGRRSTKLEPASARGVHGGAVSALMCSAGDRQVFTAPMKRHPAASRESLLRGVLPGTPSDQPVSLPLDPWTAERTSASS